jgi:sec-independent protein translocase protein TatC
MEDRPLSLIEHLEELRRRVIWCILAYIVCATITFNFAGRIIHFLSKPAGKLIFIEPAEAFVTYIKIALWGGLFLASPFIIYQAWRYVGVALKPHERRAVILFVPFSSVLFLAGLTFGFYVIVRIGMPFLISFGSDVMTPMLTVSRYISFVANMALAFGVVFQLPLAMYFLTKIGIFTPAIFSSKRRYAIVLIFIAAAVLTPGPDVFSQLLLAGPLLVLYEAGIILSKTAYRHTFRNNKTDTELIQ